MNESQLRASYDRMRQEVPDLTWDHFLSAAHRAGDQETQSSVESVLKTEGKIGRRDPLHPSFPSIPSYEDLKRHGTGLVKKGMIGLSLEPIGFTKAVTSPLMRRLDPGLEARARAESEKEAFPLTAQHYFRAASRQAPPVSYLPGAGPGGVPLPVPTRPLYEVGGALADMLSSPSTYLKTAVGAAAGGVPGAAAGLAASAAPVARALKVSFAGKQLLTPARGVKAYEALERAGEAAKQVPGVSSLGRHTVGLPFRPPGVPRETWDLLLEKVRDAKARGAGYQEDLIKVIRGIFQGLDHKSAIEIREAIEGGRWMSGTITDKAGNVISLLDRQERLVRLFDEFRKREHEVGIMYRTFRNYFPHVLDNISTAGLMKKMELMTAQMSAAKAGSPLKREIEESIIESALREPAKKLAPPQGMSRSAYKDLLNAVTTVRTAATFAKQRKHKMTIQEMDGLLGWSLFLRDPAKATSIRAMRHAAVFNAQDMLQSVITDQRLAREVIDLDLLRSIRPNEGIYLSRFGAKMDKFSLVGTQKEALKALDTVEAVGARHASPDLPLYIMDRDVARALNDSAEIFRDSGKAKELIAGWKEAHNLWKAWTLPLFPAYHFRNEIGNFWNNWLGGLRDMSKYAEAAAVQGLPENERMKKMLLATRRRTGISMPGKVQVGDSWVPVEEVHKWVKEDGVATRGFFDVEAVGGGLSTWQPWKRDFYPIHHAARVGRGLESNARIALYLDRLAKGSTRKEAATAVRTFLFDYSELSSVDHFIRTWIFPFWGWTRKNVPLQLQMMAMEPGKYTGLTRALQAVHGATEGEISVPEVVPQWLEPYTPIRVWRSKNQKPEEAKYFAMGYWLPAADLVRMFDPGSLADMLTPVITISLSELLNVDVAMSEPYDIRRVYTKGEKRPLGPVEMDARLHFALTRASRLAGEFYRVSQAVQRGEGKQEIPRLAFGAKLYDVNARKEMARRQASAAFERRAATRKFSSRLLAEQEKEQRRREEEAAE